MKKNKSRQKKKKKIERIRAGGCRTSYIISGAQCKIEGQGTLFKYC